MEIFASQGAPSISTAPATGSTMVVANLPPISKTLAVNLPLVTLVLFLLVADNGNDITLLSPESELL